MQTPVDHIEDMLEKWKHQTWGFVIYRSTYEADEDFAAFVSSMKESVSNSLKFFGADHRPVARQVSWKIFDDRDLLGGASKTDVRRMFDEWAQSSEAAAEQPDFRHPIVLSQNARHWFCVLIDRASLESFKNEEMPWVNVIMRDWPWWPEEDREEGEDKDLAEDEQDDCAEEEIECCIEEDVGWCKVRMIALL